MKSSYLVNFLYFLSKTLCTHKNIMLFTSRTLNNYYIDSKFQVTCNYFGHLSISKSDSKWLWFVFTLFALLAWLRFLCPLFCLWNFDTPDHMGTITIEQMNGKRLFVSLRQICRDFLFFRGICSFMCAHIVHIRRIP